MAEKGAVLAGARTGIEDAHAGLCSCSDFLDEQIAIVLVKLKNGVEKWQFEGRCVRWPMISRYGCAKPPVDQCHCSQVARAGQAQRQRNPGQSQGFYQDHQSGEQKHKLYELGHDVVV